MTTRPELGSSAVRELAAEVRSSTTDALERLRRARELAGLAMRTVAAAHDHERRTETRKVVATPESVRVAPRGGGRALAGRVIDFSDRGMQLELEEPLEPGTVITLEGCSEFAEVRWSKPALEGGRHRVGVHLQAGASAPAAGPCSLRCRFTMRVERAPARLHVGVGPGLAGSGEALARALAGAKRALSGRYDVVLDCADCRADTLRTAAGELAALLAGLADPAVRHGVAVLPEDVFARMRLSELVRDAGLSDRFVFCPNRNAAGGFLQRMRPT